MQPDDVLLFTDWTMLRLFPPLRATWSRVGEPAVVPITGANAKRVLFGALNVCTGHRVVLMVLLGAAGMSDGCGIGTCGETRGVRRARGYAVSNWTVNSSQA